MTLIDFDQKELLDIYRALQYTRFEECPVPHDDEGRELYNRLTKLMEKVSKTRSMCTCNEMYQSEHFCSTQIDLQHR